MKNINVKLVIVILGVCSFLGFCFGIPATSEANPCKNDDDIAIRDGSGQIICRLLKKCPHGMGLNFKVIPGKIYPQGTKTSCPSCIKGKTYSNTYDYSLCQDCTKCQENEISTGQCIIDKDTTNCTGKCKEGFYRINSMCLPCSQCCGNGHDIKPPDCSVGTVSMNKRCSQETRKNCSSNETVAVDTGIDEKNHTKPPKSNNAVVIAVTIFVVVAIVIFVGTVYHYSNLQNNHCLGNNNCDEITPSPTTSESVIEMFPPADTKHVINTTQPSLGRSVNNSRSNPLYADPEPIQARTSTSVVDISPEPSNANHGINTTQPSGRSVNNSRSNPLYADPEPIQARTSTSVVDISPEPSNANHGINTTQPSGRSVNNSRSNPLYADPEPIQARTSTSVVDISPEPSNANHGINTTQPSGRSVNNSRSNPLYADPEPIQARTSTSVVDISPEPSHANHGILNTTQPSLGRSVDNSRSNPIYADPEPIQAHANQGIRASQSLGRSINISNLIYDESIQAPPTSVIEMFPDSYINVPMSLDVEQTEQQDIDNPCQERLDMLVIHIPKELYVKICELLDQLHVFFQDHRMLGNELGMATSDVEKLGDNPTDKLLNQYNISVDCFLKMLREIRGNISQSHQNPRVDKAIELVESWLDK